MRCQPRRALESPTHRDCGPSIPGRSATSWLSSVVAIVAELVSISDAVFEITFDRLRYTARRQSEVELNDLSGGQNDLSLLLDLESVRRYRHRAGARRERRHRKRAIRASGDGRLELRTVFHGRYLGAQGVLPRFYRPRCHLVRQGTFVPEATASADKTTIANTKSHGRNLAISSGHVWTISISVLNSITPPVF